MIMGRSANQIGQSLNHGLAGRAPDGQLWPGMRLNVVARAGGRQLRSARLSRSVWLLAERLLCGLGRDPFFSHLIVLATGLEQVHPLVDIELESYVIVGDEVSHFGILQWLVRINRA